MMEPEPLTRLKKPLSKKEEEVASLVGRGFSADDIQKELATRGRFVTVATVRSTIRDIANKIDCACDLTPVPLIRLFASRTTRAA